ncbi:MAG: ATP-binding protein [Chloroflexi bacterium]|nr:ATP-binding protein [Chloroflexota bacterium]
MVSPTNQNNRFDPKMMPPTNIAQKSEYFALNIPARVGYLSLISECIRAGLEDHADLDGQNPILYNVQLAVQEICTNIITHAYRDDQEKENRIWIEVGLDPGRITIQLEDSGDSFDLPDRAAVEIPSEPKDHGYGLFLIYSLVDDLIYQPGKNRNRWVIVKFLE